MMSDVTEIKLCVNCKWFTKPFFMPFSLGECKAHENSEINLVDGQLKYKLRFAENCRIYRCGPEAKWFNSHD